MNTCDCLVFYSHEIIKTTPEGALDLDATTHMLRTMTTPDELLVCEVLFDLRDPPCPMPHTALDALAREMGRIDHVFVGKIALLSDADERDAEERDPTVETSPDGRYQTAHFIDFDDAMHWLTV